MRNSGSVPDESESLRKLLRPILERAQSEHARRDLAAAEMANEAGCIPKPFELPSVFLTHAEYKALKEIAMGLKVDGSVAGQISEEDRLLEARAAVVAAVEAALKGTPLDTKALLETIRSRLRESVEEFTFQFPLENLRLETSSEILIGGVLIRNATAGELDAIADDSGESGHFGALAEVKARGSREVAYQRARHSVHYALSVVSLVFRDAGGAKSDIIGIAGEAIRRRRGPRVRKNTAGGSWRWHDGTGPGLPLDIPASAVWTPSTPRFFRALTGMLTKPTPDDLDHRLLRAVFWAGSALATPVGPSMKGSEDTDVHGTTPDVVATGRRIRDLVTAVEALFKRDWTDPTAKVRGRLERCLTAINEKWTALHFPAIKEAYKARHDWTHDGFSPIATEGVTALAAALRVILPTLVVDKAAGRIADFKDLDMWVPA